MAPQTSTVGSARDARGPAWRAPWAGPGVAASAATAAVGRSHESLARAALAPLLACALVVAWALVAPQTPDLAGQYYRAHLFAAHGFLLWDDNWYAGHHLPGYSLLFPPLGALLGVRLLGGLAAVASAVLFVALARSLYRRGTLPAELFFALAAAGDAWIGRVAFALGVTFALAATLALVRARVVPARVGTRWRALLLALACALAALSAASSPVAGLLLALAAASWAVGGALGAAPEGALGAALLGGRRGAGARARALAARARAVAPLVAAPVAVALAMQALFPEGGSEPFAETSVAAVVSVTLAFLAGLPPRERLLRAGGAIYLGAAVLAAVASTPMGSNVARYGVLLAGPLLCCALFAERRAPTPGASLGGERPGAGALASAGGAGAGEERGRGWRASRLPAWALACVLAGIATWVVWGPVAQALEVSGERSTRASFYAPLLRFLAASDAGPVRVEVPFTRAHWEAAWLAPRVSLARGWERQLDRRYNAALEASSLDAAAYRRWLERNGVSFVALPDVPFDHSSAPEVRLVRAGLPYLREAFHDAGWRVFRVLGATPLAEPIGARGAGRTVTLAGLGHDRFALLATAPGRYLVRVHFTPYWAVVAGVARVREGPDGFTEVRVLRPGRVAVEARFGVGGAWRALGESLRAL